MSGRLGFIGGGLLLSGAVLVGAGAVVAGGFDAAGMMGTGALSFAGMMGGGGAGMMGGGGIAGPNAPGPGEAGFVRGTEAAPRVIRVVAGPGYSFRPATITVAQGETVTFEVTSMGGLVHEFMVGPADAVEADRAGTPEVADIGMMQTKSVTFTFSGSGPFAFACHAPGHYEAGMKGTIEIEP